MPYYEYECPVHGRITKFFATFTEAEPYIDKVRCSQNDDGQGSCDYEAERVVSVPLPAHFYGNPEGYYKPSPAKRYSTKLVTQKGNADAGS